MTDDPRKKRRPPRSQPSGDEGENERPTVNPPFDVEAFARKATASADSHRAPPDAPTRPPPPPAVPEFEPEERSRQITLTNEVELERAREQSVARSEPPPPPPPGPKGPPPMRPTHSALSIADARASSTPSSPPAPAMSEPAPGRSLSPTSIEAAVLGAIGTRAPSSPSTTAAAPPAAASSSPLGSGPEITERTIDDPIAEMRERFSLGDYTGALEMAELILAEEPGNNEAAGCSDSCRSVLENMFAARLGPLDRVPMVVVPRTQMRWLSMDHRAGFVLSLIDGSSSIEMILDVSGMPKLDALRILHELVQQKIVAFR